MTITEPGVHYDMDADTYHADPVPSGSLSVTRAKTLLTEAGPAKFRHRADHGQPPKAEFDMGHEGLPVGLRVWMVTGGPPCRRGRTRGPR